MIIDGTKLAERKKSQLEKKLRQLKKEDIIPKAVSFTASKISKENLQQLKAA